MAKEFQKSFEIIRRKHDEAYVIIDQAVRNEEQESPNQALDKYKESIQKIDDALATSVRVPDDTQEVEAEWKEACRMIHKLKRTRAEVLQRISTLSNKFASTSPELLGVEHMEDSEIGRPRTYTELANALRNMRCSGADVDTLELVFSCDGVKLYHISANGVVTSNMDDCMMRICRLKKDEEKNLSETFFIQIIKTSNATQISNVENITTPASATNDTTHNLTSYDCLLEQGDASWIYPLIAGASPCYRAEFGALIFPDLESEEHGAAFGVLVPEANGADEVVLEILEAILHGVIKQQKVEDVSLAERPASAIVSENIIKGAYFVSRNLVRGAERAGELISYSTPHIISKINKAPPNAPPVSENMQTTVQVAKSVTGAAVGITGYIAGKVGSATMALGRFLAPHIQKHGSTLLSKSFGISENEAQEKMSGVLSIAAGAVEGFGTVYAGLEQSGSILGQSLSTNSVKVIEYRYGPSAGSLASGTFDTVGNVINLSQNVNCITPKGIAKRTAKNAGKAIVEDFKPRLEDGNSVPAGSIYPDLNRLEMEIKKS